jgi:hypothetical protein
VKAKAKARKEQELQAADSDLGLGALEAKTTRREFDAVHLDPTWQPMGRTH